MNIEEINKLDRSQLIEQADKAFPRVGLTSLRLKSDDKLRRLVMLGEAEQNKQIEEAWANFN